jgi:hypothetical protein
MKFNRYTLKKLEELYEFAGYEILYEKGHFSSGYCLVEHQKKLVINKFYDVEGRIQCLLDLIREVEIDDSQLDDKTRRYYIQLLQVNN